MNGLTPDLVPAPATGWADNRLMEAYDLIEAVLDGLHPESDAYASLRIARDEVEAADIAMEQCQ